MKNSTSIVNSNKKIGLFGGAFDPIHAAHVQLAVSAKDTLDLDEVWLLIDKEPRDKNTAASYRDRIHMAELATQAYPFIIVDKLSVQIEGKTHDHTTLIDLKDRFPFYTFSMIFGIDILLNFHKWEAPEVFCNNVDFAIAGRPPYTEFDVNLIKRNLGPLAEKFRYRLIDFQESSTSSTLVRSQLLAKKYSADIHPEVHDYILKEQLYTAK